VEEYTFRAMNTDIVLLAEGVPEAIGHGFDEVRALIQTLEARFTRFSDTSELAQLNRAGGTWFRASKEMFEVVREACVYVDQTDGLFDPAVLDALEWAGYDKSMDEIRAGGAGLPRFGIKPVIHDFRAVQFDVATCGIRLPQGMRLDLGGIAKGWIVERAARALAAFAEACAVSAGGDIFTVGLPADESAWRIAIENPHDAEQILAILRVGPGAVATSSIRKRCWRQGDHIRHHLIDPRRGAPAETDWSSVTVIAPHATAAEAFAKALLIAGSDKAERIAARHHDLIFLAIDNSGQLWGPSHAKKFLDVGIELV